MDFLIAGTSAVGACCFTNPLEVLKTRMQLQGELKKKGQHVRHYKNIFKAAHIIVKNEGIIALQKGLVPALCVQFIMNGMRLGTYQFGESNGYILNENGNIIFYKSVLIGGLGGVLGQFFASPFFLIKTHLQTQAVAAIAVGYQHNHRGMYSALQELYQKNGVKGLFRGAFASIPRAFVGSVSQLVSFKYVKEYLNKNYDFFVDKPILTSFIGSTVGGIAVSVMMTPFDLILTRLYNQPIDASGRGILYLSYWDCVKKIYKTEGISAFYKGIGPMYLRLGPHTVLCLVFWDILKDLQTSSIPKNMSVNV